uniref:Uncharacterized protein n=1 Tax=Cyprinus carpio TaxID=7962 RepID=A0A8C1Z340_CYPCA
TVTPKNIQTPDIIFYFLFIFLLVGAGHYIQVCMNLVDIMPRRQQAVIEVKGGPTKY